MSSVNISLPDGTSLSFPSGVTGTEVAASIGPGLAKAALVAEVDGKPVGSVPPDREGCAAHNQARIPKRWS